MGYCMRVWIPVFFLAWDFDSWGKYKRHRFLNRAEVKHGNVERWKLRKNTGKLTWNPKMEVWKMIVLFNWVIFRFHVNFQGRNNWDVNIYTKVMSRTMDVLKNFMEDTFWISTCLAGSDLVGNAVLFFYLKGIQKEHPWESSMFRWDFHTWNLFAQIHDGSKYDDISTNMNGWFVL